jgi:hypothetical protein
MSDGTSGVLEYGGVRIDLSHVTETSRLPMISEAQAWIDAGQRPPLLTVRNGGADVSTRPDLWPADVRNYRGRGRLEWVGE